MRWSGLADGARAVEERFDAVRFGLKRRLGLMSPFEILPYRGHGTPRELFLKGRVLEATGITRSGQRDTAWRNLGNMVRRFASDEVPGARVRASFGDLAVETVADGEGFFDIRLASPEPLSGPPGWYPVEVELLSPGSPGPPGDPPGGRVRSTGQVLVPREAKFGVISDIDDTVVLSGATNVLKMIRITLLNNAHTRLPFEGVSAFYTALQRGASGRDHNPIFYVSSSPWNIYDVLEDFLDVHGVPAGPLFLKDWSPLNLGKHEEHKLGIIRTLLGAYPGLPFVLIGDSGQEDPEVYLRAAREHPGRIRAVYIRDVTATARRDAQVRAIAEEAGGLGVEMVPVSDTATAAEHAVGMGLITEGALLKVRARGSATLRDYPGS